MITCFAGSTPRIFSTGPAVSMRPEVAMAQGMSLSAQIGEQFARAGKRPRAVRAAAIILDMEQPQLLQHLRPEFEARLARQRLGEEAARHADLAVQPPDRDLDAFFLQRIVPGQHMVIDAVDQRAVEIEQEGGLLPGFHGSGPRVRTGLDP